MLPFLVKKINVLVKLIEKRFSVKGPFLFPFSILAISIGLIACSTDKKESFPKIIIEKPQGASSESIKEIPSKGKAIDSNKISDLLEPLLLPSELKAQVEFGRDDPFQPIEEKNQAVEKIYLQLFGLIAIKGKPHAIVKTKLGSGLICESDRGMCSPKDTSLLPPKINVISINLNTNCIIYQHADKEESTKSKCLL